MSKKTLFLTIIFVFFSLCWAGDNTHAQGLPFPAGTHDVHRIIVKFTEGSDVRLRDSGLWSRSDADIASVSATLHAPIVIELSRFFDQNVAELDSLRGRITRDGESRLADLNLYYEVRLSPETPIPDALAYIASLNAMPSIETAYPAPLPAPPDNILSEAQTRVPSPDYAPSQGYRDAAPQGMGIDSAWALPGGRGDGVTLVDLEYAWNYDHEDYALDVSDLIAGDVYTAFGFHHGTAVLGEIIGADNGIGVTGLTPNATVKLAASMTGTGQNIAQILLDITAQLPAGSVVLIEQQTNAPFDVNAACTSELCDGFVPVEVHQAVFDAIQYATANGIIVVELAGNGSINLDHPLFNNRFKRTSRDSGAILVGAANPTTHQPYPWSNTGSRIDVYGWGDQIYTTAYGDLFSNGVNANQDYTASFAGTSGASAMVTGAVIALQGIAKADSDLIGSLEMRALLRSTGTPQGTSNRKIGAMPNLAYALVRYFKSDGNLLVNPGFEPDASGWKVILTQNDGVNCRGGYSAVGVCAFRFSGNSGENSQFSQRTEFAAGDLGAGDTVNLSFLLNANDVVAGGTARLIITYTDGTKRTGEILLGATGGVYMPQTLSVVVEKPVRWVRVVFNYRGTSGKLYIDEVKLST